MAEPTEPTEPTEPSQEADPFTSAAAAALNQADALNRSPSIQNAARAMRADRERLKRLGILAPDGAVRKVALSSATSAALADLRRAQNRLATSSNAMAVQPRRPTPPTSAQDVWKAAGDRDREEREQHAAEVAEAGRLREQQLASLDVIASAAVAASEATTGVQGAVQQLATDTSAAQTEALRIARRQELATYASLVIALAAMIVAIIAL